MKKKTEAGQHHNMANEKRKSDIIVWAIVSITFKNIFYNFLVNMMQ